MRIAILQSHGKHEANWQYRECECLVRALGRYGVDTRMYGPGYSMDFTFDDVDAIVILQNYELGWVPDLSQVKKPKLFWSIDSHRVLRDHITFAQWNNVDKTLCAVYGHDSHFKDGVWFPNAYPVDLINPIGEKKIDVGFCGRILPQRVKQLQSLQKEIDVHVDEWVLGDAMVEMISSYRIHWNFNYSYDINYRTFETMGCGTCLVTNKTPGIDKLFVNGRNILLYSTVQECILLLKAILKTPSIVDMIAVAGMDEVRKHHTYDNRAKQIVSFVKELTS